MKISKFKVISMSASENMLKNLIEKRLKTRDKEKIDREIDRLFGEEWAVVFTDLTGFSRSIEKFGIHHFLSIIYEKGRILKPVINESKGLILKEEADSWVTLFKGPEKAVEAMIKCQNACRKYNKNKSEEDQIHLCVGIGYGKVLKIGDSDVWGKEVNLASKLGEDVAKADEILLTPNIISNLNNKKLAYDWKDKPFLHAKISYNLS